MNECVRNCETKNESNVPSEEKWNFGNLYEFILYSGLARANGNNAAISMMNPDEYYGHYKKGFDLYDAKKYGDALAEYRKAAMINPIAINARFEICECFLAMGEIKAAEQVLLDSAMLFCEKSDASRFYRRMSYIASEKHQWKLAMALAQFSITYEYSEAAKREIDYIVARKGNDFDVDDPEAIIRKARIPIIKSYSIENRDSVDDLSKVFNLNTKQNDG